MFDRTYYATHPDMMECVSNDELRDRYLIQDLFRDGQCVLNYTHAERFVIGGVAVASGSVTLPHQSEPASAAGHPFLERREMAVVNVGKVDGTVTVDGETFTLGNKDCLYVTMGAKDVVFSGDGARFYLASCPAHKAFTTRTVSVGDSTTLERGSLEESNERTIHQMVIPGICDSAQLVMGLTVLEAGFGVEHDAAAHPRTPQRDLFLLRTGRPERPRLPLHGRRRSAATHRDGERGSGDQPALVGAYGFGDQGLCLHLGDGRREPGLYRHERARHLSAGLTHRLPSLEGRGWG